MTLETVFYTLGIVFMSLSLFILVAIVVLIFYIKNKVTSIANALEEKIDLFGAKSKEIAIGLGAAAAGAAVKKVKAAIKGK